MSCKENNKKELICSKSDNYYVMLDDGREISLKELMSNFEEQPKLLKQQLNSATLDEVISMIAHQWKQPIQIISILVQKIAFQNVDKATEDIIKEVRNQLEYMSSTIDDFKNFFNHEKKKRNIKISQFSKEAKNFLGLMFAFDEIEFKVQTLCEDDTLYIHTNELMHVFINIFKNARDMMLERETQHRKIVVTNSKDKNNIIIQIEDNTGGIPQNIMDNIFKPYFTTKDEKGAGLGLYMCKKIIEENYKGAIEVENGKTGAIFTIKLPINLGEEIAI